jgi:hypothetical protein
MKVKQILSIKEIADDKKLPCDMYELHKTKYMSVSRDELISIADMDIVHLVRAFKNDRHRLANQLTDKDLIRQNEDLVSANRQLARQHDIWKEKAMNMMEKSSYDDIEDTLKNTIKSNNELIQLNKQLKESLRQVNLTPTVSTQAYDIAWKNIDELNDQVKSLLERNAVLSNLYNSSLSKDSETSDTWKEKYEHEAKMAESWKSNYYKKDVIKGCGYTFSEIPNDTDGQEFVDTMKKYLNKKSYKMRVRGQHIKPELKGTGATYWGQNKDESSHMRVYIDIK